VIDASTACCLDYGTLKATCIHKDLVMEWRNGQMTCRNLGSWCSMRVHRAAVMALLMWLRACGPHLKKARDFYSIRQAAPFRNGVSGRGELSTLYRRIETKGREGDRRAKHFDSGSANSEVAPTGVAHRSASRGSARATRVGQNYGRARRGSSESAMLARWIHRPVSRLVRHRLGYRLRCNKPGNVQRRRSRPCARDAER